MFTAKEIKAARKVADCERAIAIDLGFSLTMANKIYNTVYERELRAASWARKQGNR